MAIPLWCGGLLVSYFITSMTPKLDGLDFSLDNLSLKRPNKVVVVASPFRLALHAILLVDQRYPLSISWISIIVSGYLFLSFYKFKLVTSRQVDAKEEHVEAVIMPTSTTKDNTLFLVLLENKMVSMHLCSTTRIPIHKRGERDIRSIYHIYTSFKHTRVITRVVKKVNVKKGKINLYTHTLYLYSYPTCKMGVGMG